MFLCVLDYCGCGLLWVCYFGCGLLAYVWFSGVFVFAFGCLRVWLMLWFIVVFVFVVFVDCVDMIWLCLLDWWVVYELVTWVWCLFILVTLDFVCYALFGVSVGCAGLVMFADTCVGLCV